MQAEGALRVASVTGDRILWTTREDGEPHRRVAVGRVVSVTPFGGQRGRLIVYMRDARVYQAEGRVLYADPPDAWGYVIDVNACKVYAGPHVDTFLQRYREATADERAFRSLAKVHAAMVDAASKYERVVDDTRYSAEEALRMYAIEIAEYEEQMRALTRRTGISAIALS